MSKPNIIMIITDEQRFDTIAALGFPKMITPNLDKLAAEGVVFNNCFCTSPSCVPSRASLFNCKYPGRTQVFNNCNSWGTSWVEELRSNGYHCINVGKMHTMPYDTPAGFHQRYVVENKDRPKDRMGYDNTFGRFDDEWEKFLAFNGVEKPTRITYKASHPLYETALGAYDWELDERYHPDIFVGNMAKSVIKQRKTTEPLFLQIGFPGPHPPFDPPKRFVDMYEGIDFFDKPATEKEKSLQTEALKHFRERLYTMNMDAIKWLEHPTAEQLGRLRKYYAANVTLIDDQIGGIMRTLKDCGYLENAIIMFISDHGDNLGNHGLITKWNMYDCVTRVPAILWSSTDDIPAGKSSDVLVQHFDLAHTVLSLVGISLPEDCQSISFADQLRDGNITGRRFVYAEHSCDPIFTENPFITMVRDTDYKLVYYQNVAEGELYDLKKDPGEIKNVWFDQEYQSVKNRLIMQVLNFKCEHHYGERE